MFFNLIRRSKDTGIHKGESFKLRPDQIKTQRLEGVDTLFERTTDFFKDMDTRYYTDNLLAHVAPYTSDHLNHRAKPDERIEKGELTRQLNELFKFVWRQNKLTGDAAIGKLGRAGFLIHNEIYSESVRQHNEKQAAQRQAAQPKERANDNHQRA